MDNAKRYIDGVPCWVDSGRVNPDGAMEFYGGLFGWEFENQAPPEAPVRYMTASLDGLPAGGLGEQPDMDWAPVWNTFVRVADAEDAAKRVVAAGGEVEIAPMDAGPAGRWAALKDPQGASFCVWQAGTLLGASAVNEPGGWVFSSLVTPDVEEASRFYGEVFGWKVSGEIGEQAMVQRPGYADHIDSNFDPEFKERLASYDSPEGFGDVVAWFGEGEGPPRWEVTFAVTDADEAAVKVAKLGGEVVTPPFDAPWVRNAVVRDTDGVEFTVSQFMPPE